MFVHALTFVVRTDRKFLALRLRHARAVDFEVIAVGVVEINFRALGSRTRHRADKRNPPFLEMLGPFFQIFR